MTTPTLPRRISALALCCALVLCSSCQTRNAQRATQISLTTLARGVVAVDEIAETALATSAETARQHVLEEQSANPDLTVEEGLAMFRAELQAYYDLAEALEVAHGVLLVGQSSVDVWVDTGDLPEQWSEFCSDIESVIQSIFGLLRAIDVEVPEELEAAVPVTSSVCNITARYMSERRE